MKTVVSMIIAAMLAFLTLAAFEMVWFKYYTKADPKIDISIGSMWVMRSNIEGEDNPWHVKTNYPPVVVTDVKEDYVMYDMTMSKNNVLPVKSFQRLYVRWQNEPAPPGRINLPIPADTAQTLVEALAKAGCVCEVFGHQYDYTKCAICGKELEPPLSNNHIADVTPILWISCDTQ